MLKVFGLMKAAFTEVFHKNNIFNDRDNFGFRMEILHFKHKPTSRIRGWKSF